MAVPPRNLNWLLLASVVGTMCHHEAGRNQYVGILSESIDKISNYYVEPVDPRKLFEGGMRGMVAELDPYSGYISPDDYAEFRVDIEQQFGGIGIEVGIENDRLTILNPVPGTPAYDAGLMAGDIIIAIDDNSTENATLDDAVKLMRGPIGTTVKISVLHLGDTAASEYEIERAQISIESVRGDRRDDSGHWIFRLEQAPDIGYVRLTSFGDRTTEELRTCLEALVQDRRLRGIILDVRGNAGGLLSAAVDICDMFIPANQTIVSTRGRGGLMGQSYNSRQPPLVPEALQVVVLVDRFSASASEIVAACLQDYERAIVVGERTWGKGTVQNVLPLERGRSAIRLTTQTYWRPSGQKYSSASGRRRRRSVGRDAKRWLPGEAVC